MKKLSYILAAMLMTVAASLNFNAAAKAKEYKTVEYDVHLHCEDCVKKVKENISFEKGVKGLEISLENQSVKVTFDIAKTDEEKIAKALRKLGYEVHEKANKKHEE